MVPDGVVASPALHRILGATYDGVPPLLKEAVVWCAFTQLVTDLHRPGVSGFVWEERQPLGDAELGLDRR